ncbi:Hypothetical predicted protein [Podarcis lilfordi]|uniref:Uncharacterized protein n=1 Tax=Podarcis lilfordi TaxID=74358 RepID=A0AA35KLM2_9SAUR|nr:Hypothetical predicted protein [Podarcis lilfordi]
MIKSGARLAHSDHIDISICTDVKASHPHQKASRRDTSEQKILTASLRKTDSLCKYLFGIVRLLTAFLQELRAFFFQRKPCDLT